MSSAGHCGGRGHAAQHMRNKINSPEGEWLQKRIIFIHSFIYAYESDNETFLRMKDIQLFRSTLLVFNSVTFRCESIFIPDLFPLFYPYSQGPVICESYTCIMVSHCYLTGFVLALWSTGKKGVSGGEYEEF